MSIFRFARWIIEGEQLQLTGDGTQSRDFTYVGDIARGTILGLKKVGYQIINLGSDSPYSINDMIHLLEEKSGKIAKIIYLPTPNTDMNATWADISKAKNLLGWKPEVEFPDGLQALVDWYVKERDWASQIDMPKLF
jgi:nucleoside-diphosphate-sugar epimerase